MGGTTIFLGVVAFLGKNILINSLTKDLEEFKSDIQRELKLDSRKDLYVSELALRQLDAAQEMWSLFEVTSISGDRNSIIIDGLTETPSFDIEKTKIFIETFNSTFSKKSGLFISRDTRVELYKFRNFIIDKLIGQYETTSNTSLSRSQVDAFLGLRTAARLALRNEVGSEDITIAKEEYKND